MGFLEFLPMRVLVSLEIVHHLRCLFAPAQITHQHS